VIERSHNRADTAVRRSDPRLRLLIEQLIVHHLRDQVVVHR